MLHSASGSLAIRFAPGPAPQGGRECATLVNVGIVCSWARPLAKLIAALGAGREPDVAPEDYEQSFDSS